MSFLDIRMKGEEVDENESYRTIQGGLFIAVGLIVGTYTYSTYSIGTLTDMGPGFFPLAVSVVVAGAGGWLLLRGLQQGRARIAATAREMMSAFEIIPFFSVVTAIAIFATSIETLGIWTALVLSVLAATIKRGRIGPVATLVLAVSVATACSVIFVGLIGMPLKLLPF